MSQSAIALTTILAIGIFCCFIGLLAGKGNRKATNLEQWSVGGRNFGAFFVWFLMAGEIFTTFVFLGGAGWAYTKGAPVYYILTYAGVAYALSYFILPPIWKAGKRLKLVSQPDFFIKRYDSRLLGALVAFIGVAFMIPYLQMQLTGLGIIVEVSSYGAVGRAPAMILAFALVALFTFTSGLKGSAWASTIKDLLMIIAVLVVGIGLPYIYHGGIGHLFAKMAVQHPDYLILPGNTKTMGVSWFVTTCALSGMGFYMWPHIFGSVFSSKSGEALKKNAIFMPLYGCASLFLIFVGFTALLTIPGLQNGDMAFFTLARQTYPAWFVGFLGGAGALTAMVPASVLLISASTLIARNVYQQIFRPDASDKTVTFLARSVVVVLTAVSLYLAIFKSTMLVNLLLIGYNGISQFFPAVILGLLWKRTTKPGALSGIIVGIAIVGYLTFNGLDPFMGCNGGFIAMVVNAIVLIVVSLLTSRPPQVVLDRFFGTAE